MTQNIVIRESEKTGKKTIVLGEQKKVWDKDSRTYTQLMSLGLRITSRGLTEHNGKVIEFMKMAISNVYFEAQESKDGGVHFIVSPVKTIGMEDATAEFKMNQKIDGLKNAKNYIMKKFGKNLKWEDFRKLCDTVYGDIESQKREEREKAKAKQLAKEERTKSILGSIVI